MSKLVPVATLDMRVRKAVSVSLDLLDPFLCRLPLMAGFLGNRIAGRANILITALTRVSDVQLGVATSCRAFEKQLMMSCCPCLGIFSIKELWLAICSGDGKPGNGDVL